MGASVTTSLVVMTYNILIGGAEGRIHAVEAVIRAQQPDIVGVQEANDPAACLALADRLGMQCVIGYSTNGYHVALLSRWPIRSWANYGRPIFQKGLIEVVIDVPDEPLPWHIFVGHLTADFYQGYAAERHRTAEIREIVACMATARSLGHPHALLGDFNTLAPGEPFDAVSLIARVSELDAERARHQRNLDGQPHLKFVVPPVLHPLLPVIRAIPTTPWLAGLCNFAVNLLLPRQAVPTLQRAGYVDCLRHSYPDPRQVPPTCPLPRPAGRIDYLWADPVLAERLQSAWIVQDGMVDVASDHRPVVANFAHVTIRSTHFSTVEIPQPAPLHAEE